MPRPGLVQGMHSLQWQWAAMAPSIRSVSKMHLLPSEFNHLGRSHTGGRPSCSRTPSGADGVFATPTEASFPSPCSQTHHPRGTGSLAMHCLPGNSYSLPKALLYSSSSSSRQSISNRTYVSGSVPPIPHAQVEVPL